MADEVFACKWAVLLSHSCENAPLLAHRGAVETSEPICILVFRVRGLDWDDDHMCKGMCCWNAGLECWFESDRQLFVSVASALVMNMLLWLSLPLLQKRSHLGEGLPTPRPTLERLAGGLPTPGPTEERLGKLPIPRSTKERLFWDAHDTRS